MTFPRIDEQIDRLEEVRLQVAAISQTLSERELAGRVMRLEIEARLRTENAGMSATQAEKLARSDAGYLAHEKRSIELAYDREVLFARAEAQRFDIELQIAALRRESVGT